jgi:AmmeMemoRadiSam system protein A
MWWGTGPMSFPDQAGLNEEQGQIVLDLAVDAIEQELRREHVEPSLDQFDEALCRNRASFVTLQIAGQLRGCIGTLEALRPLALDVFANARSAAFRDPRFAPLTDAEFARLDIHVSILSLPEAMSFGSEADLIAQLRPGVDGLVLEEGARRGTFLPSVWESLQDPRDFFSQLKRKAGLPEGYWSHTLRVSRYTTQSIPD